MPAAAPLSYGRKSQSRGNTFTMTFGTGGASGQGVLVPCAKNVETIDGLVEEAIALWQAEDVNAKSGCIYKSWGCVGALFSPDMANSKLASDWAAYFRRVRAPSISVIEEDGRLNIPWPNTMDGQPADLDVILATATKPDDERPAAIDVANAWLAQSGRYEGYFFENVRHNIRTPDDGDIWRRIEVRSPSWLTLEAHKHAIQILRSEAAKRGDYA
jgi:hypothetical protein